MGHETRRLTRVLAGGGALVASFAAVTALLGATAVASSLPVSHSAAGEQSTSVAAVPSAMSSSPPGAKAVLPPTTLGSRVAPTTVRPGSPVAPTTVRPGSPVVPTTLGGGVAPTTVRPGSPVAPTTVGGGATTTLGLAPPTGIAPAVKDSGPSAAVWIFALALIVVAAGSALALITGDVRRSRSPSLARRRAIPSAVAEDESDRTTEADLETRPAVAADGGHEPPPEAAPAETAVGEPEAVRGLEGRDDAAVGAQEGGGTETQEGSSARDCEGVGVDGGAYVAAGAEGSWAARLGLGASFAEVEEDVAPGAVESGADESAESAGDGDVEGGEATGSDGPPSIGGRARRLSRKRRRR